MSRRMRLVAAQKGECISTFLLTHLTHYCVFDSTFLPLTTVQVSRSYKHYFKGIFDDLELWKTHGRNPEVGAAINAMQPCFPLAITTRTRLT